MSQGFPDSWLLVAEWTSVVFNLLFSLLIAYEKRWGWLCGFIGSTLAIGLYALKQTWALSLLQLFFAIMGIYGYWNWGRKDLRKIAVKPMRTHVVVIGVGAVVVFLVALFLREFLDGSYPIMDAFITVFSLIATFLMAWKWFHHWVYWIVIDAVWLVLNIFLEFHAFATLSVVYLILSVFGLVKWRNELSAVGRQ